MLSGARSAPERPPTARRARIHRRKVRVEKNDMRLKDGDLILLLTDGITDAFGGERQTAQWLEEKFLPQGFANPQDAADFILQAAQEHCQKEPDDMTVQAARFWKKIA